MVKSLHWSLFIIGLVSLCSCSQHTVRQAPVLTPEQLSRVVSPIPRAEPRSRYGNPSSYEVFGVRYQVMDSANNYDEQGKASWYGPGFQGKLTSTRETYDMYAMTAAHKSLPLPCFVEVTNLLNGRQIVVRVNDRGPFVEGRIIDLSYVAAQKLDMVEAGTAPVRVRALTTPTQQVLNYEKIQGDPSLARGALVQEPAQVASQTAPALPQNVDVYEAPAVYEMPTTSIYLQVGAFSQQQNALDVQSKLVAQQSSKVRILSDLDNSLHRVQIGPLLSNNEALQLQQRLIKLGYQPPKIIRSN